MKQKIPICFLAPGGGLGHLVRSTALALELIDLGVETSILSSSPYSAGMARITGLNIQQISLTDWATQIPQILNSNPPRILVTDTFPSGIRNELLNIAIESKVVYIARHLKFDTLEIKHPPLFDLGILIEPLQPEHEEWINNTHSEIFRPAGIIRFPYEAFDIPMPPELQQRLDENEITLVVHSGPKHELEELCSHADADQTVIISPRRQLADFEWYEYFPACRLYEKAAKIITAAGYNSMAETAQYREKHIAVPFARNYDDQFARTGFDIPIHTANPEVARKIHELL